ncbi:MAG: tRNA (N6-isopentenyl adenosine(37)-C2)-methylthiotransferase MiaB [Peptococcaceae bacterium]|nr:tRNA (N6-isopentenyl adenosine(37)-C2)-methylthiotransferase MiaB [Peptococcaceae bacterium]
MNEHDSQILAGILDNYTDASGAPSSEKNEMTTDIKQADIIVVNTCCIRESAETKILGYLGSLKKYKTANPHVILVVCGCMAQESGAKERIKKRAPHIDIIFGTFNLPKLQDYIRTFRQNQQFIYDIEETPGLEHAVLPVHQDIQSFKGKVNIIYGCNNFCAYCIVPYVRGRERSRSMQHILNEVRAIAAAGGKEVMLLGQNVNSYGKDFPDGGSHHFATLLEEVSKVEGIERIRYMSAHPKDFHVELIDTIAALPKVCKHFHLPLQSGCNQTLKDMNRGYTTEQFWHILEAIRKKIPECAITTDMIVGFPSELERDFQETLEFVDKCAFDDAYTFLYSPRTGTVAAKREHQIPDEVKNQRLQQLLAIQNKHSLANNQKLIGSVQMVLVEGRSKTEASVWTGRTDTNKIVNVPAIEGDRDYTGLFVPTKIVGAKTWYLKGEFIR